MNSAWLTELHRQWQRARGGRAEPAGTAFSRDWQQLLEAASVVSADDIRHAEREASALEAQGRIRLGRYRHRIIRRVRLPVEQEPWLRALFRSDDPAALREASMATLHRAATWTHELLLDHWSAFCAALADLLTAGKNRRPFHWTQPESIESLLRMLHTLTNHEWPHGTLVRDVSARLFQDSKAIERRLHAVQSALGWLIHGSPDRGPLPLESLNILTSNSRLLFDGPLTLHFADGTCDESRHLRHGDFVTAADLDRAVRVTTTASRIVSVENSKTTFRNLAAQNTARDTLLITTSFPTRAVRLLLEKLPLSLPHWHFGDTDPAGYFILLKLRQLTPRPVQAWQMDWRDKPDSPLLSAYDVRTLTTLIGSSEMADCHDALRAMRQMGRKGAFEQEEREATLPG